MPLLESAARFGQSRKYRGMKHNVIPQRRSDLEQSSVMIKLAIYLVCADGPQLAPQVALHAAYTFRSELILANSRAHSVT